MQNVSLSRSTEAQQGNSKKSNRPRHRGWGCRQNEAVTSATGPAPPNLWNVDYRPVHGPDDTCKCAAGRHAADVAQCLLVLVVLPVAASPFNPARRIGGGFVSLVGPMWLALPMISSVIFPQHLTESVARDHYVEAQALFYEVR